VKTCNNFTKVCRTPFPPKAKTAVVQCCELNRSRTEARCLIPFPTTAEAVDFPFVEQAARLTRCMDSQKRPADDIETEYLLCSRPSAALSAGQMLQADRRYWGIETGLHLRLDVIAGEDRSRVCNRTSALNLAMMRRAVVSVAVHWIIKCRNPRKATMSGFFDFMSAKQSQKAFSLVTACHSSWLPIS
jgi:predicted transposase YbfD/YdcC